MRQCFAMMILFVFCAPALAAETTGTGLIVNRIERTLQAELPGTLVELLVQEGQHVKQGDIVAIMRSHNLNLRARNATTKFEIARIDLKLAQTSVEEHEKSLTMRKAPPKSQPQEVQCAVAEFELAIARLKLQRAEALAKASADAAKLLKRQLDLLAVRAPVDGKIATVLANVGDVFGHRGAPLVTVCGRDELAAQVRFPAKAINLLSNDGPNGGGPLVTLRIEALGKTIEGQVTRVSPAVEPSSQTLQATIVFDDKELPMLRPGMKVTAELKLAVTRGTTR